MAEFDLHSNIDDRVALNLQDITTGTVNGAVIDTSGFESIEFVVQAGAINDGTYTLVLEESDDAGFTVGVTLVTPDEILGVVTLILSVDDNTTLRVGSIGKKRYQRLSIVAASSTGVNEFSAIALLGHPHTAPIIQ